MGKKRIYELAKEWNKSSKEVVEKAQSLGFDVKNHMGAISDGEAQKLRQSLGGNPNDRSSENQLPQIRNQPTSRKNKSKRNLKRREIILTSRTDTIIKGSGTRRILVLMVKDNPTAQQVKTTDQQIKEVIDQITKEVKIE